MENKITKQKKEIFRIITILVTTIVKYIEFLFIRTDQTIIADNVITKILCIIATLVAMKICGLKLADIGLKLKNTFKYVVCGFGLVFFTFTISYGLEVALLAEEGMFRGFILKVVTERSGFKTGNYLQAFLFGIWHIVMCVLSVYDGQMSVGQAVIFAVGYVVLAGILALEWGTCVSMTGVL